MKGNKVKVKKFLGEEIRIIEEEFIVLKDMFKALGRVDKNGKWSYEKNKLINFLDDIDKLCDFKTLEVTSISRKSKAREKQMMECLKIDTVPIALTQFKPTSRKRLETYSIWKEFMKFVDKLLESAKVYRYIINDKQKQKEHMDELFKAGGNCAKANIEVNRIMAKLLGVYDKGIKSISKNQLKEYDCKTTMDLLEVRECVMRKFIELYKEVRSYSKAGDITYRIVIVKYEVENVA